MRSQIFYTDAYKDIQEKTKILLNNQRDFLSEQTAGSTRAVGDAVQNILGDGFQSVLGDLTSSYSADFARRAMADIAFEDQQGMYYIVDVKTHRSDTGFNMPNLTSVQRLARLYEDDKNIFAILLVSYTIQDVSFSVTDVVFQPIEFLGWDCLTIGALGWGQIQIANTNRITIQPQYSRKRWMIEFCDRLAVFYPNEILDCCVLDILNPCDNL